MPPSPHAPNHRFEGTAQKLRFSVPSALPAPAAHYLKRYATCVMKVTNAH